MGCFGFKFVLQIRSEIMKEYLNRCLIPAGLDSYQWLEVHFLHSQHKWVHSHNSLLNTNLYSHCTVAGTAVLFWQFGESTAAVPRWGSPPRSLVGWRGGWISDTQVLLNISLAAKIWAHGSELFILWSQPAHLCLTRPLFDAAAPSQQLNEAVELL